MLTGGVQLDATGKIKGNTKNKKETLGKNDD